MTRVLLIALGLVLASCGSAAREPPRPRDITPQKVASGTFVDVRISGEHFDPQVRTDFAAGKKSAIDATFQVRLVPAKGAPVPLAAPTLVEKGTLVTTVPATLERGVYDLTVVNPDGQQGTLTGAFRVVTSAENVASFRFDPIGPQRAGIPFQVAITAVDATGRTVDGFEGSVALTSSAGAVSPDSAGPFALGKALASLRLPAAAPAVTLTATDALGHPGQAAPFEIKAGLPIGLAFTSAAQRLPADVCSAPVQLETRDVLGAPAPLEASLTLELAAGPPDAFGFFSDAACTQPLTAPTLAARASSASFFVKGRQAGPVRLRASTASLPSVEQGLTVIAGPCAALAFTGPAQSATVGACSPSVGVGLRDAFSNACPAPADVAVALVAMPVAGFSFFSDALCATPASGLTIAAGQADSAFFFKGTSAGQFDVSGTSAGLNGAGQTEAVIP